MKNLIYTLILLLFTVSIYAQNAKIYEDKKGKNHLWGPIAISDLQSADHEEWYTKYSKDYQTKLFKEDAQNYKDIKVEVFLGTWCGDTKFLVPKFIKEWESMGLNTNQLDLVALHNVDGDYKQGPNNETLGKNIHRVPTFIFYKENEEIGRIVERSVFDLTTDMNLIVNNEKYEERYQGQQILSTYLEDFDGDTLVQTKHLKEAMKLVRREVSTSSELNAYGYVLMAQNEMEKAEFVFLLNRYLYPYNPNIRDSYGEFLFKTERYEDATSQYNEVLRLKGSDKNATRQLNKIYDKMEKLEEKKV